MGLQLAVFDVSIVAIALSRMKMNFFKRCFDGRDDILNVYCPNKRNKKRKEDFTRLYCLTSNRNFFPSLFVGLAQLAFDGIVYVFVYRFDFLKKTYLSQR